MAEIRTCQLTGEKVIIAPERLHRPLQLTSTDSSADDITLCPFEKGSESATPKEVFAIYDKEGNWICRVVPNLYHALSTEEQKTSLREGFFTSQTGLGAHEVIIETPSHDLRPDAYTLELYKAYLRAIITRIQDLSRDIRLEHIQVFKNYGSKAGASLVHPHSQIIATAFIPPHIDAQVQRQRSYFQKHNRPLLLDIVGEELRLGNRVIYENDTFAAFCPYASKYPFEVIIAPKIQIDSIENITTIQKYDLAHALKAVYGGLFEVLGDFDFNMMIHNAPPHRENNIPHYFYKMEAFYTFYVHITPRLYTLAGYELSTSIHINTITPEDAATKLQEKISL